MIELPGLKFDLGEDIEMLRSAVRDWAQGELAPRAEEIDRTDQFPMDAWRKLDLSQARRNVSQLSASTKQSRSVVPHAVGVADK